MTPSVSEDSLNGNLTNSNVNVRCNGGIAHGSTRRVVYQAEKSNISLSMAVAWEGSNIIGLGPGLFVVHAPERMVWMWRSPSHGSGDSELSSDFVSNLHRRPGDAPVGETSWLYR
jgi:outer membrane protease